MMHRETIRQASEFSPIGRFEARASEFPSDHAESVVTHGIMSIGGTGIL
jgi:hypothetical protein